MKNKLLNAMKSLPMTIEDKQEFVNTIVNNSKGGGEAMVYYYKFNSESCIQELNEMAEQNVDDGAAAMILTLLTAFSSYIWYDDYDSARGEGVIKFNESDLNSLYDFHKVQGIIVEDIAVFAYPYFIKGDFNQKWEKAATLLGASMDEIIPIVSILAKHLTLVTKEEFYSNLDKQPIIL